MKTIRGIKPDPRGNGSYVATISDPFLGRRRQFSFPTQSEAIAKKLDVVAKIRAIQAGRLTVPEEVTDDVLWLVKDGKEGFAQPTATVKCRLVAEVVDAYLDRQKKRADVGGRAGISMGRFHVEDYHLRIFQEYCQSHKAASVAAAFDADNLEGFKLYAAERFPSAYTLREATYCVKALITWAWETHRIGDLPRTLKTFRHVSVPDPKARNFKNKEIAAMFSGASVRTKLYILLALNAGYTQKDIADLRHESIDWKKGIIDEVRGKVLKLATVPRIVKLWPLTLVYLKGEATDPSAHERVLLSEEGQVLVQRTTENGKPRVLDCIQRSYQRLKKKSKVKGRSFKDFRKTGAALIRDSYLAASPGTKTNQELFKMYLAHKPPRIDLHYAPSDWKELHKATDWLGHFLGLYDGGSSDGSG